MLALATPDSLAGLVASYLDLKWNIDPVAATLAGLTEHDHRLGRYSEEDTRQHVAALKSMGAALEDVSVLTLDDEIDRTALLNELRVAVQRLTKERPHGTDPSFHLAHLLDGLYTLLAARDRSSDHRARAAAGRLREIPAFLETAEDTLGECPKVFVETALQMVEGGARLIADVAANLRPTGDEQFGAVRERAEASLGSFARYLSDDLLKSGNGSFAIGEDAFNFRLHYQHALRHTAPELWRYGVRLVEETNHELERMARDLDTGARWPDIVDRLRGQHPTRSELVPAYACEMERAYKFVVDRELVPVPAGPLEVLETPSFLKPLTPFAAYQPPGVFSADRSGRFYVTPPDESVEAAVAEKMLRDHCVHELACTALHEGYPGHHLQFLVAQSQPRLARKILGTPLTIEGWALYCEEMMGEEGFYSPEEQFFQKVNLLWRAVRIVLDVGLHTRDLAFDEAVSYLMEQTHFERHNAESEVRRYCAYPAYQLSYAVGRREIRALRDAFRESRGADYSLRSFHEAVLPYGGLPVSLMRWGLGLDE